MKKAEIERINTQLKLECWGDIDPDWFRYIDFKYDDLSEYDESHIALQRILQNKPETDGQASKK